MVSKLGFSIGFIVLLMQLFLVTNTSLFFTNAEQIQLILLVYLVMEALIIASLDLTLPTLGVSPLELMYFGIGFIITAFLVYVTVPAAIASTFEIATLAGGLVLIGGILYVFVKAFVEEIIFRGILEKHVGRFMQAILFGIFHFAILSAGGASWQAVLIGAFFLGFLGLAWSYTKDFMGLMGAVGSHTAWNLHAVGLLAAILAG